MRQIWITEITNNDFNLLRHAVLSAKSEARVQRK